jgi:hypothetical protein
MVEYANGFNSGKKDKDIEPVALDENSIAAYHNQNGVSR